MTRRQDGAAGDNPAAPVAVLDETSTVLTRLQLKKVRPGRSARRRQARRSGAFKRSHRTYKAVGLFGREPVHPHVNPSRDHRSRKSGRLRKELR